MAHDRIDKAIKRSDAVARFATAKEFGAGHHPMRPSTTAPVFLFDFHGKAGLRGGLGCLRART
ncbi:MAG: hypothetical protein A3H27_10555 [Acidobacteria bacterium RIFCSPLOWO2_02_FULL_59_13]|nr:MAG: hypothetical protein A3H27_10555 [Acidobacteria bacterium RIFCSPLOWO2_02_FULL_59_13]